jgi:ABC-type iron transport system FetAB permease component
MGMSLRLTGLVDYPGVLLAGIQRGQALRFSLILLVRLVLLQTLLGTVLTSN